MPATLDIVNSDPFCAVRLDDVEHLGRKTDKKIIVMQEQDADTFSPIPGVSTVHGDHYNLVTNRAVRDMAVEVMDKTKLEFRPVPCWGEGHSENLFWNGRRYAEKWYCPDTQQPIGKGGAMMLGLEITNSYDGSCKVGLAFFAMRLECSNQFYSNNLLGKPYELQHVNTGGDINEDMQDAFNRIKTQAGNFGKVLPAMRNLMTEHCPTFDSFLNLRKRVTQDTKLEFRDRQVLDELSGCGITQELKMQGVAYNDPSSHWDILNAYTAVTTHAVGGPRGSDMSQRVTDWFVNLKN